MTLARDIKVLFCTDGVFPYSIGGMQRHSKLLIEELVKTPNIKLTVVHPHQKVIFNDPRIEEICLTPIDPKKNYLLECYKYSKRVYNIITQKPDHIIYSQGLSVWYNIKRVKNSLIVNPHGLEPYQTIGLKYTLKAIPFKLIFNHIFKYSNKIISLGGKLTTILNSDINLRNKIVEIPNAVNVKPIEHVERLRDKKIRALFLGRFVYNKGIDTLFKAIDLLDKKGYSAIFDFTLVGEGPLLNHYQKLNCYKNLNITGKLADSEIEKLYMTSDVFVLPTLFEGMPTVVLEAMSFGLPIIVSNVGATAVLVDKNNGILIAPGSTEELVDALLKFKDLDEVDRRRMSGKSYEKVISYFTWSRVADSHVSLFRSLDGE